jgi:hypothetical protein
MGNDLAVLVTWGAFLVDGNHLTNLMSIGEKSTATGPAPPPPAIVGGLNTHTVFEGAPDPINICQISLILWLQVMRVQLEETSTLATIIRSTKHFSIRYDCSAYMYCTLLCIRTHGSTL